MMDSHFRINNNGDVEGGEEEDEDDECCSSEMEPHSCSSHCNNVVHNQTRVHEHHAHGHVVAASHGLGTNMNDQEMEL